MEVSVELSLAKDNDSFIVAFPTPSTGAVTPETKMVIWNVNVTPEGRLLSTTPSPFEVPVASLFWEAALNRSGNVEDPYFNFTTENTACIESVKACDWLAFTLSRFGLVPREYTEMVTYWAPYFAAHKYLLIKFAEREEVDSRWPLLISPIPQLLRVYIVFKGSDGQKCEFLSPQDLTDRAVHKNFFTRSAETFCAIEWGGTEVTD